MFKNHKSNIIQSDEIESKVMRITPQLAQHWLHNHNEGNRPIRKSIVSHYAEQMKLGRWKLSPQPIIFARKKGRLLDGQHRLSAVVLSKCAVEAQVSLVKSESIFKVLDQGKVRSNSDILSLPNSLVSPIQFLLRITDPTYNNRRKVVSTDIEPFLNSQLMHRLTHINETIKPKHKKFKTMPFRAAFAVATCTGANFHTSSTVYKDIANFEFNRFNQMMKNLYFQFDQSSYSTNQVSILNPYNEYFMRGLYLFFHVDGNKNTIRIGEQFKREMLSKTRKAMMQWRNKNGQI